MGWPLLPVLRKQYVKKVVVLFIDFVVCVNINENREELQHMYRPELSHK